MCLYVKKLIDMVVSFYYYNCCVFGIVLKTPTVKHVIRQTLTNRRFTTVNRSTVLR